MNVRVTDWIKKQWYEFNHPKVILGCSGEVKSKNATANNKVLAVSRPDKHAAGSPANIVCDACHISVIEPSERADA